MKNNLFAILCLVGLTGVIQSSETTGKGDGFGHEGFGHELDSTQQFVLAPKPFVGPTQQIALGNSNSQSPLDMAVTIYGQSVTPREFYNEICAGSVQNCQNAIKSAMSKLNFQGTLTEFGVHVVLVQQAWLENLQNLAHGVNDLTREQINLIQEKLAAQFKDE